MVGITYKTAQIEIRRQQQLSRSIVEGQTAISTGVTLTKPSDNAAAWVQLSDVGREQAQQSAWQTNVGLGKTRAAMADANLLEISSVLVRAQELLTGARNGTLNDTARAAFSEEMKTILATVSDLINKKDYQGVPIFDDKQSTLVPVDRGIDLAVVGTRQDISEKINFNGAELSLDDILGTALAALQNGDDSAISLALDKLKAAQNHIVVEQTKQGIRADRLDNIGDRLIKTDLNLAERREGLESADLEKVISNVKSQMLHLEAAQSVYARISQQTLFDLIR